MTTVPDYSSILFTPEEIGNNGSRYLELRKDNKGLGISIGLTSLDKIMYPAFPGELWTIIARPGSGKTGFMMRWARNRAKILREAGVKDRAVMYITLEQSIEELNAFNVAADNRMSITKLAMGDITEKEWVQCLKFAIDRRFSPLWNIGYSTMTEKKQIKVNISNIEGALRMVMDKQKLDIVFVDYLQRIPYDDRDKTIGISNNLDSLKTIAQQVTKCPIIVGAQAKREVDAKPEGMQIPDLDDGQWTSNIEQSSDRVISLVRPINYVKEGDTFFGKTVTGRNMLLINVLKQKLGPANLPAWAFFQPEYNKLDELEMEHNQ